MREVCFILTQDQILRIYFGSPTRVPDSRERWEVIWKYRNEITEIVHTHPSDFLKFSNEDLTTMDAVEAGTACKFTWSVVTHNDYIVRHGVKGADKFSITERWWMHWLRELSFKNFNPRIDTPVGVELTKHRKESTTHHEQNITH